MKSDAHCTTRAQNSNIDDFPIPPRTHSLYRIIAPFQDFHDIVVILKSKKSVRNIEVEISCQFARRSAALKTLRVKLVPPRETRLQKHLLNRDRIEIDDLRATRQNRQAVFCPGAEAALETQKRAICVPANQTVSCCVPTGFLSPCTATRSSRHHMRPRGGAPTAALAWYRCSTRLALGASSPSLGSVGSTPCSPVCRRRREVHATRRRYRL